MKEKLLGIFLSILLLFSFLGCGSKNSGTTGSSAQTVVYINATAHKYHRQGCIEAGPNPVPTQLSDAKKNGYRPCNKCDPPK